MWEIMLEIIRETEDSHCPVKEMKIREDTPQWITKETISELNLKDYLFEKGKKLNTVESWNLFKDKKNEVKKLLNSAKENFVKNKLDKLEGDPKKIWRTINNSSGIGKNKNGKECTKIVDESGNVDQDLEAATFLNNFYANVGPTLAQKHKKVWTKEKCKIRTDSSFSFSWVTDREVKNSKLSTVHHYEYHGFLLDDRLSMNDYLNVMWKKTNSKLGILSKIRRFISEKTAVRIYKTMIQPHLDYIEFVVD